MLCLLGLFERSFFVNSCHEICPIQADVIYEEDLFKCNWVKKMMVVDDFLAVMKASDLYDESSFPLT